MRLQPAGTAWGSGADGFDREPSVHGREDADGGDAGQHTLPRVIQWRKDGGGRRRRADSVAHLLFSLAHAKAGREFVHDIGHRSSFRSEVNTSEFAFCFYK